MNENEMIAFLTLILSGGVVSTVWIISRAWVKRNLDTGARHENEKLEAAVDQLHREFESLRAQVEGQVGELHERLDFAERLLTRGSQRDSS